MPAPATHTMTIDSPFSFAKKQAYVNRRCRSAEARARHRRGECACKKLNLALAENQTFNQTKHGSTAATHLPHRGLLALEPAPDGAQRRQRKAKVSPNRDIRAIIAHSKSTEPRPANRLHAPRPPALPLAPTRWFFGGSSPSNPDEADED